MALNIKDPLTDRLARELAAATGEPITVAARKAIEERLARVRAQQQARRRASVIQDVIGRGRARAELDDRRAEDILGYDDDGLPR